MAVLTGPHNVGPKYLAVSGEDDMASDRHARRLQVIEILVSAVVDVHKRPLWAERRVGGFSDLWGEGAVSVGQRPLWAESTICGSSAL